MTGPRFLDGKVALVTGASSGTGVELLCSGDFDFVTGQRLVLDGGRTLPRFPRLDVRME